MEHGPIREALAALRVAVGQLIAPAWTMPR
jgi:hypothetical protein